MSPLGRIIHDIIMAFMMISSAVVGGWVGWLIRDFKAETECFKCATPIQGKHEKAGEG
jgi:hypothetical protein